MRTGILLVAVLLGGASSHNAAATRQVEVQSPVTGEGNAETTDEARSQLAEMKPYTPSTQVFGVISNFGNNYIPSLMKQWEVGFRRVQPGVQFETKLPGSEAAMAGLSGGIADLAFIGRESYPSETHAFEESLGYPPLDIEISSGSFATPHKTFALMVFVHKDNPLAKLSLPELARIYGCSEAVNGGEITEWGQLGLKGTWEHLPIHVMGTT